jgi:hypothetical protein
MMSSEKNVDGGGGGSHVTWRSAECNSAGALCQHVMARAEIVSWLPMQGGMAADGQVYENKKKHH